MKQAAWLIGAVVVICTLLGVFMFSHHGDAPAAANAQETDSGPVKNAAQFWQAVPPPAGLTLDALPGVPASLSANRLGPVSESYVFSRGSEWRLVGLRTQTMVIVPLSWEVEESESSSELLWPVIPEGANPSAGDLKDAIAVSFYGRDSDSLQEIYKRDAKMQQDVESYVNRGVQVGPLHTSVGGAGFFTTSMPGRIMITLYVPAPGHAGEGYQCLASTSAVRWKSFGKTFEAIITHWYDAKGNALYPGFHVEDAIR